MDISVHRREDGSHLLLLGGELDAAGADEVRRAAIALINSDCCDCLVIDVTDVAFIDRAGIGALVGIRDQAIEASLPLSIIDTSDPVARLLRLTRLDQVRSPSRSAAPSARHAQPCPRHDRGQ
jgi:anti-sigma B factor antagonist